MATSSTTIASLVQPAGETREQLLARAATLMRAPIGAVTPRPYTLWQELTPFLVSQFTYNGVSLGYGVEVSGVRNSDLVSPETFKGFMLIGADLIVVRSEFCFQGTYLDRTMAHWLIEKAAPRRRALHLAALVGGGAAGLALLGATFGTPTEFAIWCAMAAQLYSFCGLRPPGLSTPHSPAALAKLQAMLDAIRLDPAPLLATEQVTLPSGVVVDVLVPARGLVTMPMVEVAASEFRGLPAWITDDATDAQLKAVRPAKFATQKMKTCDRPIFSQLGIVEKSRSGKSCVMTLIEGALVTLGGDYPKTFDGRVGTLLTPDVRQQADFVNADTAALFESLKLRAFDPLKIKGKRKTADSSGDDEDDDATPAAAPAAKRARNRATEPAQLRKKGLSALRTQLQTVAPAVAASFAAQLSAAPRGTGQSGRIQAELDLAAAELGQLHAAVSAAPTRKPAKQLLQEIAEEMNAPLSPSTTEYVESMGFVTAAAAPTSTAAAAAATYTASIEIDEEMRNALIAALGGSATPLVARFITSQPMLQQHITGSFEDDKTAVVVVPCTLLSPESARALFTPNESEQRAAADAFDAGVQQAVEDLLKTGQPPRRLLYSTKLNPKYRCNSLAPGVELRGQEIVLANGRRQQEWGVVATRAFATGEQVGFYGSSFLPGGLIELNGREVVYRLAGLSEAEATDNYVIGDVTHGSDGRVGAVTASGVAHFGSVLARANHSTTEANIAFDDRYNAAVGGVAATATRPIAAGDAVLANYGREWLRDARRLGEPIGRVGALAPEAPRASPARRDTRTASTSDVDSALSFVAMLATSSPKVVAPPLFGCDGDTMHGSGIYDPAFAAQIEAAYNSLQEPEDNLYGADVAPLAGWPSTY